MIQAWYARRRADTTSASELATLRAQRQALQDRFRALAESTRELSVREAPAAGLLIGMPTHFTRDLAQKFVAGFLGEVTLRLRNLKVSKADDVQARILFGQRTVGRFVLDVEIPEVVATLRPLQPKVTFAKERLGVSLGIALVEGRGNALVHLLWDSHGVASAICGDVDVVRELQGTVAPADYHVDGAFTVAAQAGAILLKPRFGEINVTVRVLPSPESWKTVDAIVEQQGALCRAALRRVDVKRKLSELIERGFSVKLPAKLFREIRLPAGIRQSLDLQGLPLTVAVRPVGVAITPSRIWYGANITMERRRPGSRAWISASPPRALARAGFPRSPLSQPSPPPRPVAATAPPAPTLPRRMDSEGPLLSCANEITSV